MEVGVEREVEHGPQVLHGLSLAVGLAVGVVLQSLGLLHVRGGVPAARADDDAAAAAVIGGGEGRGGGSGDVVVVVLPAARHASPVVVVVVVVMVVLLLLLLSQVRVELLVGRRHQAGGTCGSSEKHVVTEENENFSPKFVHQRTLRCSFSIVCTFPFIAALTFFRTHLPGTVCKCNTALGSWALNLNIPLSRRERKKSF